MIINENIICQSYNDNTYQSEVIDDKKIYADLVYGYI